jgi:hypothetical protein
MTKPSRKLNLKRETIQPLQSGDLDNVHGGATPAVSAASVVASFRFCAPVSRAISAASAPVSGAIQKGWEWVQNRRKK